MRTDEDENRLELNTNDGLQLDAIPFSCVVWDRNYNVIDCNEEALRLFGLHSRQELYERIMSCLVQHPSNCFISAAFEEYLNKAFENNFVKGEWILERNDGEVIPLELYIKKTDYMETDSVIVYFKDIREISASFEDFDIRMRLMLDAVPLCCYYWDENYQYVDCNQEALELFKLASRKEFMERFYDLSPEYQPDGMLSKEKMLQLVALAFERGRAKFEWLHQTLNGVPIPAQITLVRVGYKDRSIIACYTTDLRELKASMDKVLEADERAQVMLDSNPLCCNFWDVNCNNIDCNQEAVNLFDLSSKQEYLDKFYRLSPLYQPDGRLSSEKIIENVKQVFKTGYRKFDWMHQKLDGELIPTEIIFVRVKQNNQFIVVGYTRDLRELISNLDEIRKADERAQLMLDSTPLCCNYWDRDFNNIDCNQAAVTLFDLSNKQEYLERFFELSPEFQPDGQLSTTKAIGYIRTAFETGYAKFEWTHCKLSGELIPAEIILVRVESKDGYIVTGYTRDLREIKATMEEIRKADERAQVMLEATPLCCNLWDTDYNNIDCNQEAVNLFELCNKQEYLSRFFELSPEYQPDGRLSTEKAVEKIKTAFETGRAVFEWMHQKLDGELIPAEITLVRVNNKEGYIVAGYTRDLRELKATVSMLNQLEQLAFYDSLTEIYNRRYFMDTAKKEFVDFEYRETPMSILMMDIDNFKRINDTHGHVFGDKVLKHIALTIKKVLRPADLFARYGGEEFIIMIKESSPSLALKLAKRIRTAIEKTKVDQSGTDVKVTISIGVATRMNKSDTLEDIILKADEALYRAKVNGRNRVETN